MRTEVFLMILLAFLSIAAIGAYFLSDHPTFPASKVFGQRAPASVGAGRG